MILTIETGGEGHRFISFARWKAYDVLGDCSLEWQCNEEVKVCCDDEVKEKKKSVIKQKGKRS